MIKSCSKEKITSPHLWITFRIFGAFGEPGMLKDAIKEYFKMIPVLTSGNLKLVDYEVYEILTSISQEAANAHGLDSVPTGLYDDRYTIKGYGFYVHERQPFSEVAMIEFIDNVQNNKFFRRIWAVTQKTLSIEQLIPKMVLTSLGFIGGYLFSFLKF